MPKKDQNIWTNDKPNKPGYYWCYSIKDGLWVVNIKQENDDLIVYEQGEECGWHIDVYNFYDDSTWWCVINEPSEPQLSKVQI